MPTLRGDPPNGRGLSSPSRHNEQFGIFVEAKRRPAVLVQPGKLDALEHAG
jgi:hypothetical protein